MPKKLRKKYSNIGSEKGRVLSDIFGISALHLGLLHFCTYQNLHTRCENLSISTLTRAMASQETEEDAERKMTIT
ncbi:hypothetical protein HAX54_032686 [Datura stramonium]|uniref:Uncharacterized protein n=1 Tax=Datura stramonium TaxID=4076 RepID=A0ABS8VE66_DATST|nr:hypothetical protein [Datura stramonium]